MGPQRLLKTRNRTRDLDQISTDLSSPHRLSQHLSLLPLDELPALGQLYCTPCARFLESQHALSHHQRSKTHKKRLKLLSEPAYSHEEANAAVGRGIDNGSSSFDVLTAQVMGRVGRDRIQAAKKAARASAREKVLDQDMEVEVTQDNAPQLVEKVYDDDDNDL
ncbi:Bud site selection protein 20 [Arthrobotrys musiformis]|uniref:Bud site selection protein 20 n=1 Tax=Arthrobotrys musiformis TaxID=47236 RepID=A0AAV9WK80_9PEZI